MPSRRRPPDRRALRCFAGALALATTSLPLYASADRKGAAAGAEGEDAQHGVELALRIGYALPRGKVADDGDADLDGFIDGQVPVGVDVGYRIVPHLYVGAFFDYGFGSYKKYGKASCADCSSTVVRFGLMGAYHFLPRGTLDPWIGVGFGYELASLAFRGFTTSFHGPTIADIQVGIDVHASPLFGIGPFIGYAVGVYVGCDLEGEGTACSIKDKASHAWLSAGAKGTFSLF